MGYRSSGAIYLSKEAQKLLTDEMIADLKENWETEDGLIYEFSCWKWYSRYKDVQMWEDFMDSLEDQEIPFDFIRIGEETEDIEIKTGELFYCERSIGYY